MPINPNIAMGVNPIQFKQSDPLEQFGKQLQLKNLISGQADDELTRQAMIDSGGDSESMLKRLISGGASLKSVSGVQKMIADQAAAKSKMTHEGAQTGKLLSETESAGIAKHRDMLSMVRDPQTAAQWIQMGYSDPVIGKRFQSLVPMDQAIQSIPQDPAEFQTWVQKQGLGATKFIEMNKPVLSNRNLGNVDELTSTPGLGGAPTVLSSRPILESEAQRLTRERQTADAKASRDQSAYQFSERQKQAADQFNATKDLQRERLDFDKSKPAGGKTVPMSVTLQKELLESDDTVQSAKNVVGILENAKKINKDAYSGYFAKGRATLASNMPGKTPGADATIDIDNMMTGQALESLKTIFGGMPTEGERKILLEMQASVDKTPEQREAIMDRAMAAAKRRGEYAGTKAKSIRDGSYLSQGMPEIAEPPKPGKTIVRTGTLNGRKVNQYSDGTTDYAN